MDNVRAHKHKMCTHIVNKTTKAPTDNDDIDAFVIIAKKIVLCQRQKRKTA